MVLLLAFVQFSKENEVMNLKREVGRNEQTERGIPRRNWKTSLNLSEGLRSIERCKSCGNE